MFSFFLPVAAFVRQPFGGRVGFKKLILPAN